MKHPAFRAVLIVLFVLGISGTISARDLRDDPSSPLEPGAGQKTLPDTDTSANKEPQAATISPDGTQQVSVEAGEYYFEPDTIMLRVGIPVELSARKSRTASAIIPHNITANAPEAGIAFNVDLDREPTVIRFTPTKTGSYEFYCDKKLLFLESHREKGMKGVFNVVDEQ